MTNSREEYLININGILHYVTSNLLDYKLYYFPDHPVLRYLGIHVNDAQVFAQDIHGISSVYSLKSSANNLKRSLLMNKPGTFFKDIFRLAGNYPSDASDHIIYKADPNRVVQEFWEALLWQSPDHLREKLEILRELIK